MGQVKTGIEDGRGSSELWTWTLLTESILTSGDPLGRRSHGAAEDQILRIDHHLEVSVLNQRAMLHGVQNLDLNSKVIGHCLFSLLAEAVGLANHWRILRSLFFTVTRVIVPHQGLLLGARTFSSCGIGIRAQEVAGKCLCLVGLRRPEVANLGRD